MKKDNDVTIMIVDDNTKMREVIKDSLAGIPCDVVECSNGMDAVHAYERLLPEWVLMDVMMQPMNGIEALTEIRRKHPDAKVIMVTNSVEESVSAASFRAGAFAFVRKETLFQIQELIVHK